MNKIKLFTHTDLDGIGCSIIAKLLYDDEDLDISYVNYDEINIEVEKWMKDTTGYSNCYITDISVSDEVAQKLDKLENVEVKLFDHHPTALELNKYDWCKVQIENDSNLKTCGTELFFNYFYNDFKSILNNLKIFVEKVRDWDTWRWVEIEDGNGMFSKKMNDLFYTYGKEEFIDKSIKAINSEKSFRNNFINDTDITVLNIKQKEIDDYINIKEKEMKVSTLCNYKFGMVFADKYISEMGNKISLNHPELDFITIVNMGNQRISYRTEKENIDLGKDIASLFGGGGHPKASGSSFDFDICEIMPILFKRKIKMIKYDIKDNNNLYFCGFDENENNSLWSDDYYKAKTFNSKKEAKEYLKLFSYGKIERRK